MKRSVVVCNADNGIKEALERFRGRFLDADDYLTTLRDAKIETIAAKLVAACIKPTLAHEYDACVIVFVVNGVESTLDNLRVELPGVVFLRAPFRFERAHNRQYLQFTGFIRQELVHVRRLVQALKKEFRERDSRTPLLLPVRNFKSHVLNELLIEVQKLRPGNPDYDVPLRELIEAKGLVSIKDGPKNSFFENRNSIRFYGPSKAGARHGLPSYSEPHTSACLVNAYFRLGTRYDVNFHYDCQYKDARLSGEFPNCHGEPESHSSRTHLNISPNDFIR
jgi:hypothetical protein